MLVDLLTLVLALLMGIAGYRRGLGAFLIFAVAFALAVAVVGVSAWLLRNQRSAGPAGVVAGLAAMFAVGLWLGDVREFLRPRREVDVPPASLRHAGLRGRLEQRVRHDLPFQRDRRDRTDRGLGVAIGATLALCICWWGAAVFGVSPATPQARPFVQASRFVSAVQAAVSPTGATAGALVRVGILPGLAEPEIRTAAPVDQVVLAGGVERAGRSVVRITGSMCGVEAFGSGWVVGDGLIATNAHVVTGMRDPQVRFADRTEGGRLVVFDGRVVAFSPRQDVAIIALPKVAPVEALSRLSIDPDPEVGTAAATVAFEYGRPGFSALPMRFDRTIEYTVLDVYGQEGVATRVSVLRGEILAGQSGAPVVDTDGAVLAMATASSTTTNVIGGYGVPAAIVRDIARDAGTRSVSTGPCTDDVVEIAAGR